MRGAFLGWWGGGREKWYDVCSRTLLCVGLFQACSLHIIFKSFMLILGFDTIWYLHSACKTGKLNHVSKMGPITLRNAMGNKCVTKVMGILRQWNTSLSQIQC